MSTTDGQDRRVIAGRYVLRGLLGQVEGQRRVASSGLRATASRSTASVASGPAVAAAMRASITHASIICGSISTTSRKAALAAGALRITSAMPPSCRWVSGKSRLATNEARHSFIAALSSA